MVDVGRQLLRLLFIFVFLGAAVLLFIGSVPMSVRAGTFAGACILILLAKRIHPALFEVSKARVEVDREGVRRVLGPKAVEQIRWASLVKVSIVTTDEGPYVEDFFWMLHAGDGAGCLVPLDQACKVDLLARLQRLPRFNNMALIEASGSTNRGEFVCWEGAPGEGLAASEPSGDLPGSSASASTT